MTVSIASPTRGSALSPYRLVWGLWLGFSLIYVTVYFHIAGLRGRTPQGLLLVSAFLLQAIWIPIYVLRKKFSSLAEAVIRSASAATAFDGLAVSILVLTDWLYGATASRGDFARFQTGYVSTILLLSGVVGGTALGIMRWRILRAESGQVVAPALDSWWRHYLRSAVLWTSGMTLYCWLINVALWATANSSPDNVSVEVLYGAAGLLLIAPIPVVSPSPAGTGRARRIWKYSKYAMVVVLAVIGLPLMLRFGIYFFLGFPLISMTSWPPCWFWAVLYGYSVEPRAQVTTPNENRLSSYRPLRLARPNSKIVWLSGVGQAFALFAGLLATAPASLGFHGMGCINVYPTDAAEYWFWKAYKGLASEVNFGSRMILRPSVDSSVCMTLDQKAMASISDPNLVSSGYAAAARSWSWLIDPEQWDSERTKQIRKELTRLLGRDFSSYEELEDWWGQNDHYVVWSGKDELLEVRERDLQSLTNHDVSYLRHSDMRPSLFDGGRQDPWLYGPKPMGSGFDYPGFRSLTFDREARFRALKLYAADNIQILTGERERRVREFLHDLTGESFSTEAEWKKFFAREPRQNPWIISRTGAQNWIARFHQYGYLDVPALQRETGLTYSDPAEFISWLENPANTRREEWARAEGLVGDAYDGHELNSPVSHKVWAMVWLKDVTDQTLDSPEKWVQWWQENHSNLILSADGRKLVSKRK